MLLILQFVIIHQIIYNIIVWLSSPAAARLSHKTQPVVGCISCRNSLALTKQTYCVWNVNGNLGPGTVNQDSANSLWGHMFMQAGPATNHLVSRYNEAKAEGISRQIFTWHVSRSVLYALFRLYLDAYSNVKASCTAN